MPAENTVSTGLRPKQTVLKLTLSMQCQFYNSYNLPYYVKHRTKLQLFPFHPTLIPYPTLFSTPPFKIQWSLYIAKHINWKAFVYRHLLSCPLSFLQACNVSTPYIVPREVWKTIYQPPPSTLTRKTSIAFFCLQILAYSQSTFK